MTETTSDFAGSKIAHKTMAQKQLMSTKHLQNMFQEFWNGKIISYEHYILYLVK